MAGDLGREALTYDKMGNILTLSRTGTSSAVRDALTYTYTGNRLTKVVDGSTDATLQHHLTGTTNYIHDVNGNMKSRLNTAQPGNNITAISYNHLSLPTSITATGGTSIYVYDATGRKLRSTWAGVSTDYIDGIEWEGANLNLLHMEEGRIIKSGNNFIYEYFLKDHLGNNRSGFKPPSSGAAPTTASFRSDYYPFGLQYQQNIVVESPENKYLYNGKELQKGTGMLDYGARFYDSVIGRFSTIDRYAEKYNSLNPYQYGANNPVLNIDINGDSLRISHKGQDYLYQSGKLYQNGAEYTGKVKGFLKETVNALGKINAGKEGSAMISELEGSTNNFTIVKGSSQFNASSSSKAYANQLQTDPSQAGTLQALTAAGINLQGGSGGKISWDPSGSMLPTTNGGQTNSTTDLAHEMFHGLDANRGMLNDRLQNGVKGSEWQAVYRENVLRGQIGQPLRTHYIKSVDPSGAYIGGSGVRLITPANQPILPTGYKP